MADGYSAAPPGYEQKGQPEVNYGAPAPFPGYASSYAPSYAPPPAGHAIQAQPMGDPPPMMGQPQQPPMMMQQQRRPWKSGVFDCFDDMSICLCGTFCGLCLVCQIADDLQESKCVACCVPAPVTVLRTKWRTQENIEGDIMNDCLLEAFCGACSACQLAREIKSAKLSNSFSMRLSR